MPSVRCAHGTRRWLLPHDLPSLLLRLVLAMRWTLPRPLHLQQQVPLRIWMSLTHKVTAKRHPTTHLVFPSPTASKHTQTTNALDACHIHSNLYHSLNTIAKSLYPKNRLATFLRNRRKQNTLRGTCCHATSKMPSDFFEIVRHWYLLYSVTRYLRPFLRLIERYLPSKL